MKSGSRRPADDENDDDLERPLGPADSPPSDLDDLFVFYEGPPTANGMPHPATA
jgi:hypothetical protein